MGCAGSTTHSADQLNHHRQHIYMPGQLVEIWVEDTGCWRDAEVWIVDSCGDICLTYVGVPWASMLAVQHTYLNDNMGWISADCVGKLIRSAPLSSIKSHPFRASLSFTDASSSSGEPSIGARTISSSSIDQEGCPEPLQLFPLPSRRGGNGVPKTSIDHRFYA